MESNHHSHHHHHHHHHDHVPDVQTINNAFRWGIILNILFVIIEAGMGIYVNSMALLSDAGHNLSDVISLVLALIAFKLASIPASERFTYGYRKSTILVSLVNSLILVAAVGIIIWESINKILNPQQINGGIVAWIALVGIIINGFTAYLFFKDKSKDLNIKGAYLHMAADTLVSVGVLVAGVIINFTGWYIIDPIIGIAIACVIMYSTFSLLRESTRLSMDAVPEGIDYNEIEQCIIDSDGVKSVHHTHIWALSTTQNALTAHIVLKENADMAKVKCSLKKQLSDKGIQHSTLEIETPDEMCDDCQCKCGDNYEKGHNHE